MNPVPVLSFDRWRAGIVLALVMALAFLSFAVLVGHPAGAAVVTPTPAHPAVQSATLDGQTVNPTPLLQSSEVVVYCITAGDLQGDLLSEWVAPYGPPVGFFAVLSHSYGALIGADRCPLPT